VQIGELVLSKWWYQ